MTFHRLVLLTLAAAALSGSAVLANPSEKTVAQAKEPVQLPAPPAGKGQIVFYRKPMLSLIPFNWIVREQKTEICEMVAGTYCVAAADPGTHTYEVHSEVKNDLTLEVDAGETYYVIGGISMGLIVNHPNISPAQKIQFDAISARLKSKEPISDTSAAATSTALPTTAGPVAPMPATPPAPDKPTS
ncbi:MAG TPA: hypothetical protein VIJ59_10910 [Caulobacteraceae bacterium]